MPRTPHRPRFIPFRKWAEFNSLPGLDGKRFRREPANQMQHLPAGRNEQFDLTDDREQEIARALGNDKLTKRIFNWWKKYPYATLPELIVLDFLEIRGEKYSYQAHINGGFRGGGLVPDFVVSRYGSALALLINGSYWHNLPGKSEKDTTDTFRLLNQWYNGEQIQDVVILWESRLMGQGRDDAIINALAGIEVGP